MRIRRVFGAVVLGVALVSSASMAQEAERGERGAPQALVKRIQALLDHDLRERGQARVFHYTISSPAPRVIHVHEEMRWLRMLGMWLVVQLTLSGAALLFIETQLGTIPKVARVTLLLGVSVIMAVPLTEVLLQRRTWRFDTARQRVDMDRSSPLGLFSHHKQWRSAETLHLHINTSREAPDKNGKTGGRMVTTSTLSVAVLPRGEQRIWQQSLHDVARDRAHAVAACRLIAARLDGVCDVEVLGAAGSGKP